VVTILYFWWLSEYHVDGNIQFISLSSASSRISKGQGYQGFLRKRAGSSFGQKRAICVVQGKTKKRFQKHLFDDFKMLT
jgi:hypothetical protein